MNTWVIEQFEAEIERAEQATEKAEFEPDFARRVLDALRPTLKGGAAVAVPVTEGSTFKAAA
jgi:hypothetical protein